MKKLLVFAAVFATVLMASCNKDDDDDNNNDDAPKNIVATAQATDDLSTLVAALQQANLVSALEAEGPFTVFAPTNAAFQELLDSNPAWNSLSDIDNSVLSMVLLFHVIEGDVKAADLSDSYVKTLSTGPNGEAISLQVNVTGGVAFNGDAAPSTTDVGTTNGTVHIIDKVMLPPTVVTLASNGADFSSLVAALTRSGLSTDYVDVLNGAGPFTVFAPTNAAFQALLDSDSTWNSLADIPVATLEAVLNYHVVNGANVQSDELSDGQTVSTIGGDLTVDLNGGAKLNTTSGQTVNIVATDVQGTNGVVHAIDAVLLP